VWKSADGGTEWAPVTARRISSSSVGAIEVCPADPDVVYIGMGEAQFRGDVIPGDFRDRAAAACATDQFPVSVAR
jgi:hypothetical protein